MESPALRRKGFERMEWPAETERSWPRGARPDRVLLSFETTAVRWTSCTDEVEQQQPSAGVIKLPLYSCEWRMVDDGAERKEKGTV